MTLHELVYIGATWCATCKTIKPQLYELCKKFGIEMKIRDYDEDLNDDEKDSVMKVPTVRIFVDGRPVAEFNVRQVVNTENWLSENIKLATSDDF